MLFDDTYKTIATKSEGIYKEKGSKFIALAYPVTTEDEIKEIIAGLKKEYYDARHHCYAYILGPDKSAYRQNDDGEPSGTAGRPIYGQLLSKDVTNILLVVIRYFGGIKLGVSGLINAYKTAAKDALDNNTIIEKTIDEKYRVTFDYTEMNSVMQILKDPFVQINNQSYEERYLIDYTIRRREADRINDALRKLREVKVETMHNHN
ncbi:MAG: YigZ family protein [Bacteroidales bacterium]|nr:YigZ family protein [Bacteroidales bacterium]